RDRPLARLPHQSPRLRPRRPRPADGRPDVPARGSRRRPRIHPSARERREGLADSVRRPADPDRRPGPAGDRAQCTRVARPRKQWPPTLKVTWVTEGSWFAAPGAQAFVVRSVTLYIPSG